MRRSPGLAALLLALIPSGGGVGLSATTTETIATQSADELLRRATLALETGEIERATSLYAEIRRNDPSNPAGYFGGGLAAEAAGDLPLAVDLLARAAALDPGRAATHLNHGRVLARLGASVPAMAAFERARGLEPSSPDAYLFAALLLRTSGGHREAEAILRAGIEAAGTRPELWDQLGLALLSQRRPAEAAAVAAEGLARFPGAPRLELVRGLALAKDEERRAEARSNLEAAIAGGEGGAGARIELADLLVADGRLPQAVARLEEAVELAPGDPQVHYRLGLALRQAGREAEASAALDRFQALAEERRRSDTRAKRLGQRVNAAIEHLQANELDEALQAVDEVLIEAPGHARTLALKSKILFSKGDITGARAAAATALAADPSKTEHHYLVGLFSYHLGELPEAEVAIARALAMEPDLGETHEVAAVVAFKLGRPEVAIAHFERAIELGVDHEELRRAYQAALEAAKNP